LIYGGDNYSDAGGNQLSEFIGHGWRIPEAKGLVEARFIYATLFC